MNKINKILDRMDEDYKEVLNKLVKDFNKAFVKISSSSVDPKTLWLDLGIEKKFIKKKDIVSGIIKI